MDTLDKLRYVLIGATVVGMFWFSSSYAEKIAYRCNGALINVGDDIFKVTDNCGEPELVVHRKSERLKYYYKSYGMKYTIVFRDSIVIRIMRSR